MSVILKACATAAVVCATPVSVETAPDFSINVSRHVLLHEVAHALIREFDLPILGNEETMADAFATTMIVQEMRDDAPAILGDRARSWLQESAGVPMDEQDLKGEHELDIRRAYRTICLLYGADPSEWAEEVAWIGLDEGVSDECSDIAPEVMEDWTRVLSPHRLPKRGTSSKVIVQYGEAPHTDLVRKSGLLEDTARIMRGFDWPHPVVLHFDSCGREGASWSRQERRILLCDEYFARFLKQAAVANR